MNTRAALFLSSVLWTALAPLAYAQTAAPATSESLARIRAIAESAVKQALPPTAGVSADALDERLRLPACASRPKAEAAAARGASTSVTVHCDAPAWTLYVPVRVRDLRPVLVLTRSVRRGDSITPDMVRAETRDVATLPFGYITDLAALAESELRRPLAIGQTLSPNDLEPARCVRRGDLVTLIGRAAGIEIRAEGKALADGARGSRIRVQNSTSRRVIEGTITAPGVVEM
jgi:flagella basal body P-ring formation protein FlgA